jgi:LysM repeat protein
MMTLVFYAQEKKYNTYQAQKGETVELISKKFTITPFDLLQLNPDLKNGVVESQWIIVPNKNYKPESDKNDKDFIKDGFLYHKIMPKENYFRLKKKYGVPKRILRKHNLLLRTKNLIAGETIKIPVKKGFVVEENSDDKSGTKPYLVRPKETKYAIARRYGISIEKLEELNPQLREEGLKLAEIIKVPDTEEIPDIDEDYMIHQVEKGETIFSLSQKFKLSQTQLLEFNPELVKGLIEGMLIKIPDVSLIENTSDFVPNIPENKTLKIAMMLPFTVENKALDFEKNKTLNRVTDFYLGALMALDSVKKLGLSVTVDVFDTRNSKVNISKILQIHTLSNFNAVIGPMYFDNVEFVSNAIKNDTLALISPVSSKDHTVFASKPLNEYSDG